MNSVWGDVMFISLIRWLKGYVRFEVKGKFPERFMNLCLRQGRFLFNTGPVDNKFFGNLTVSDYKEIRAVARRSGVVLKIKERHGMPFILQRYRCRSGLVFGAVFFILLSIIMQNFIWSIEINGIDSLSEAQIRTLLKENGVYEGAFKGNLNYHAAERDIMRKAEEIGWMSINASGTKVETEIQEKAEIPFITPYKEPCNLKAKSDGVILSMNIKQGSTKLTKGSAVMKGQIIVSGVIQNSLMENYLVHADADVVASTEHTVTQEISRSGVYLKPVKIQKRQSLEFLWLNIPISFASVTEPYTSRIVTERLSLNNTDVKLGITSQYCTLYEETAYELDDKTACELLNVYDYLYRLFSLKDCMEIESSVSVSQKDDKAIAYIKYNCIEDIGYVEKIVVN